ncbi:hypothetical protein ABPG77_000350, partial [Micractinium sp. CCAP 211/92]
MVFSLCATTRGHGETLFVVGPSGVGKSLLLRELAYLDPFDSGAITLAGKSPSSGASPSTALWSATSTSRASSTRAPRLSFTTHSSSSRRSAAGNGVGRRSVLHWPLPLRSSPWFSFWTSPPRRSTRILLAGWRQCSRGAVQPLSGCLTTRSSSA